MKTILRIIFILLVASTVAGAFFLVVNNGTTTSFSEDERPFTITSTDVQSMPVMQRPEGGGHESVSISTGLAGVLVTLAKLTAITLLVLSLEKGLVLLNSRQWNWSRG